MKKQAKDKTPQPQKANETSFKPGDKAAEKWTFEVAQSFFDQALQISHEKKTLTDIAIELNVYTSTFDYLVSKFANLEPIKKQILEILKNNIITKAFESNISVPMAIFVLKNNHGMTDKAEIDHTTKGESINRPIIKFFDNDESDDD